MINKKKNEHQHGTTHSLFSLFFHNHLLFVFFLHYQKQVNTNLIVSSLKIKKKHQFTNK